MTKILLTGDRPTGKLHLGHYVGSIQNRVQFQNEYEKSYYMIADVQALTDNYDNPEKVHEHVLEIAMDNLACGLDPEKTTLFIQSQVPELAELTMYFMNLTTIQKLGINPTIKSEIREKGWKALDMEDSEFAKQEGIPAGFFCYPVSQAADILAFKANVIPVGEDQKPHIEQANDIGKKFNSIYGECFSLIETLLSSTPRLVGTDGKAKASKSLNNAIFLADTDAEIEEKVMKMYTSARESIASPGDVEGNAVFQYLDVFDEDKETLEVLKKRYREGDNLGDVEVKKRLVEVLKKVITPIRTKRNELEQDKAKVLQILKEGTEKARADARKTLEEVRSLMKLDYFN